MSHVTPQEAKQELACRELARRHLGRFIKYNNPNYRENWHHTRLIAKLEAVAAGTLKRLMVFMPPRHGKSEIVSINFPAWYFGDHPENSIIAASYNSDLAVGFGRKARNLVDTQEYKLLFPGVSLAEDSKAAGRWNTSKRGEYTATGIGGGLTGRGANVLLIDDPVKDQKDAESFITQQSNYDWYRSVAETRLAPGGAIVVVQTRWHDADLAGKILAEEQGWDVLSLPAIAEEDEQDRLEGEALWPTQYPIEELEKKRNVLGTSMFSALYQQQPVTSASQIFKQSMFRSRTLEEVMKLETRCFVTIDPAPGKTENADSIGVTINFVDREGFWNLIAYRIKFNAKALIDLLFKLQEDWNVEAFGIEKGMYKDVLAPFLEAEMLKRQKWFRIVELDHEQKSKQLRIRGLQPLYEAKSIFHIEGMCDDLEEELLRFPKAAHDDVSDSTAYQAKIAERPEGSDHEDTILANRASQEDARQDSGL